MAASNLYLGKASGGVLNIQPADGTTTTSLVLPAINGTVVAADSNGNVGIGVTPSAWYSGVKAQQIGSQGSIFQDQNNNVGIGKNTYKSGANTYNYNTNDYASLYYQSQGQHQWYTAPSGTAGSVVPFNYAMVLDSSGNLGIGTPTNAWTANTAIQMMQGTSFSGYGNSTMVMKNAYYDGAFKYVGTGYAQQYEQNLFTGAHTWRTAPSGTAGGTITWTNAMTLDASGNLTVGVSGSNCHNFRKNVTLNAGNPIFEIAESGSGNGWSAFIAYGVGAFGANASNCAVRIGKDAFTGKSLNIGGTINAGGTDYAEYECNNSIYFDKGQIVGFKADGTLTDNYSESIRFAIKSTNPSYVGGDTWGNEDKVGLRPKEPVRKLDITQQKLISNAVLGDDGTMLEDAVYETVIIEKGDSDKEWELIYSTYEKDLADFEERLETERQKVDRIAYTGKVPVNVYGAKAGQYIIASNKDDSIIGIAVDNPTFEQYLKCVGRVNKILDDGRAEVAVIIH